MKKIVILVGCLAALTAVRGDLIPSYVGTGISGNTNVWNYDLHLAVNTEVTSGDFFTIYDFGPFIAGSNSQPGGWTFSSLLLTPPPSGVTPPDNPTLENLTWTYNGPTISIPPGIPPQSIGLFSVSTVGVQPQLSLRLSYFAGQATNAISGPANGTKLNNVGQISVPQPVPVPEPATVSLFALGAAGAALRALRRRRE